MSALHAPDAPSDRLLRTLASVPVSSPVLDLGCGAGHHAEALLRLGFPLHACDPRPDAVQDTRAIVRELVDEETAKSCVRQVALETLGELDATFEWVIADRTEAFLDSTADLKPLFRQAHRLLTPGGWLYLTVPATPSEEASATEASGPESFDDDGILFGPSDLDVTKLDTEFVESRSPERVEEQGEVRVHALYRRVKRTVPG